MKEFPSLTEKQIFQLTQGKKPWYEKKEHLIRIAKGFGILCETDDDLYQLVEIHCPKERQRLDKKAQDYYRTDKYGFAKVKDPQIGGKYHLAWAVKQAVFVLVRIEGHIGLFDNPIYKRDGLLRSKLSDIRALRSK